MSEKNYRLMTQTGAGNIAVGIIILTTGIVTGVIAIVNGARLLAGRKHLTF